jgi:hypothetical protein
VNSAEQRPKTPSVLACLAVLSVALACGRQGPTGTPPPAAPDTAPLASSCLDPAPRVVPRVPGPAAGAATGARFVRPLTLDGGNLSITAPPASARPAIAADEAQCNLRAARTAQNFPVEQEVRERGLSFGLASVSLRDDLLRGRSTLEGVTGTAMPHPPALHPYHQRLAWVAVTKPVLVASCPSRSGGGTSSSGGGSVPSRPTSTPGPAASPARAAGSDFYGSQILVVDANTGGDGFLYSARAGAVCGSSKPSPPHVDPAVEQVSLPWQLVSHDPNGGPATISSPVRPCDGVSDAVYADRQHPDLVAVIVTRPLADCGPAIPRTMTLNPATVGAQLPSRLLHAPVGAENTPVV